MAKIYFLFSLFFLCLFSQSCTVGTDAGSGSNNINPVPTPTPAVTPAPIYGAWKMPITLTENSGTALTDYQVCIDLSTDNITYSRVLGTNGEDLRFYIGTTACTYWIQTWNNTGKSRIWVKVPSLAANGTTTLDMYYGTASAPALSNANNTMLLHDDFSDGVVDPAKWVDGSNKLTPNPSFPPAGINEVTTPTPPYIKITNNSFGSLTGQYPSTAAQRCRGYLVSFNQYEKNISIDYKAKSTTDTNGRVFAVMQFDGVNNLASANWDGPQNGFDTEWKSGGFALYKEVNNVESTIVSTTTFPTWGSPHTFSLQYFNTNIKAYADGVLLLTGTDATDYSTTHIGFTTREQRISEVDLYWLFIRKIAMPEPTVTLGSEQVYP